MSRSSLTREQMVTLMHVLGETADVLENLPPQTDDTLTDAVLGAAVRVRKAELALMTMLAARACSDRPGRARRAGGRPRRRARPADYVDHRGR